MGGHAGRYCCHDLPGGKLEVTGLTLAECWDPWSQDPKKYVLGISCAVFYLIFLKFLFTFVINVKQSVFLNINKSYEIYLYVQQLINNFLNIKF